MPRQYSTPEETPAQRDAARMAAGASRGDRLRTWWRDRLWRTGTLTYTAGGMVLLFLWLLGGDFGFQFKERAVVPTFQLLLKQFKASDLVAGLMLVTLPQILAVVANPIVGYVSDRHRGRWGRRIPFLLATTPLVVLAMVGLAFGPALGRTLHAALGAWSPGANASVILVLGVFWTLFEFCFVVSNALLFGLITDVVPKEVVGRFFALFRIVTLAAGIIFNYYLIGRAEAHFAALFLGAAVIFGVSFATMCLKVKEGGYPPPPPPVAPASGRWMAFIAAARSYACTTLSNSYYRWIFAASALAFMAGIPINTYLLFFAKSLDMNMGTLGKYITLMLSISLVQAYPIGWLVDKFHSLRITIIALSCFATATFVAFLTVRSATGLGVAAVACGVMAGFWGTASAPLWTVLFPREKFGEFLGVQLLINAAGQVLAASLCGWTLDRLGHEYRYMYLWASGFAALAFVAHVVVYRKMRTYGGVKQYVAPA